MISVVIPALNEENYLPDCLKSLVNQDYTGPYEIIIADNGSVDETARIARDFGARVVPCPEKKSVFYARQIGADSVQGEIIAQADADTSDGFFFRDGVQCERQCGTGLILISPHVFRRETLVKLQLTVTFQSVFT